MENDKLEFMKAKVSYNAADNGVEAYVGDIKQASTNMYQLDNYNWYTEKYVPYFPHTYNYTIREDNYKKAFEIAKMLLAKDLIKSYMLPDFIKLVEEIAAKI